MLILQIRKRNVVMMFLTFAVLLLTYANTVKATLISGIAEDTVYYHDDSDDRNLPGCVFIYVFWIYLYDLVISSGWLRCLQPAG